jgi:hypothetical protein
VWADGGPHPGVVVVIVLSGFCIHFARELALGNRPLYTAVSDAWLYASLHLVAPGKLLLLGMGPTLVQGSPLSFLVCWIVGGCGGRLGRAFSDQSSLVGVRAA